MRYVKRITSAILAILLLMLSLSACEREDTNSFLNEVTLGLWDRLLLDDEKRNLVKSHEDNKFALVYQGNTYYPAPFIFINSNDVQAEKGYEFISWSGPRFFYIDTYYGDTKDSPTIIYEQRLQYTYFRADYNYRNDTFYVEASNETVCFLEDIFEIYPNEYPENASVEGYVTITSATHPTLDVNFAIVFDNGTWYLRSNDQVYFEISEHFINILTE